MEDIKREFERIKEKFAKLHIDVVDTLFNDEVEGYNNPAIYYLAKSIDMIGRVDAVYFVKNWCSARGCRIERAIAKEYNVKILEWDFIEKARNFVKGLLL